MYPNDIIITADPKGHFAEGIIDGTPLPGTFVQLKAGVAPDGNGRHTYEPYNGTDGAKTAKILLLPDYNQGKGESDAYETGKRCFLYWPLPGDELRLLFKNLTGTGSGTDDDVKVGDNLSMTDDGLVEKAGAVDMFVAVSLENVGPLLADTLVHCQVL